MAMVNAFSSSVSFVPHQSPLLQPNSSLVPNYQLPISFGHSFPCALMAAPIKLRPRVAPIFALSSTTTTTNNNNCQLAADDSVEDDDSIGDDLEINNRREREEGKGKMVESTQTLLYSFTPLPLLLFAALPGAGTVRSLFAPFVEIVKSFNLPGWLVHWGHPGNMAVVLFAMGGYGTYLGFRIRFSDDPEEKAKAKDLHPKLLAGMFFFFALGATGGVTSLLTSDKPIFESPHAVTGLIGLSLLTIQTILPSLFKGNPGLRNVHGILGSSIMTLFLVHAALGLQLGLSY